LSRVAANALLPGADRGLEEPEGSQRKEGERSRREETPKQSKEPGAAAYVHVAPPSSTSRQRLHLRPAVSTVASPSLALLPSHRLACVRAFESPSVGVSPFPHERATTRVALVTPPLRCHPRHAASAVLVNVPSGCVLRSSGRGPLCGAPPCHVPSARRASVASVLC
jgi:hypothetical protein